MTNNPEAAEQDPHATHHPAVQGQAPLGGGEVGTLHHNGDLVTGGGGEGAPGVERGRDRVAVIGGCSHD